MGYLNPALNNPAQKIKYNSVAFSWTVTLKDFIHGLKSKNALYSSSRNYYQVAFFWMAKL